MMTHQFEQGWVADVADPYPLAGKGRSNPI